MSTQTQALDSQTHTSQQDEDEENYEVKNLEAEVNQMAEKILQYRSTLPDQLKTTLASILAAQRPVVLTRFDDGSEPCPSSDPNPAAERWPSQAEENQENEEKLQLLKSKISSNASAMPILLKRMKECISRIDKLDSLKGTIHPSFKRTRTR
ncbi:hypothetical protein LguiA_019115 [Lonicera macranthoides]